MKLKNLKFKILLLFFAFYVLGFMFTPPASAQSFDIGIYPPVIQAEISPPADVKIPINLENFADQPIQLNITLKPFIPSQTENGELEYIDNPELPDPSIGERIMVLDNDTPIDSITLSPKQKKQLVLEFKMPSNEPKGEYYFSLAFTSANNINQNSSNITQATGTISSNILLTIGPLGKTQGILEDFSAPNFVFKGPIPFNVRLRNVSDHYITPKGYILITNMFNQTIGKVDLLQVNVLANSIRRIPDKAQFDNKNKDYEKIKNLVKNYQNPIAVWPELFLLGPYKAKLTLLLSDNGPTFVKTVYFFAFPAEYLLGLIIAVLIIIYLITKIRRKMA